MTSRALAAWALAGLLAAPMFARAQGDAPPPPPPMPEPGTEQPVPEAPPVPEEAQPGELEPQVTIIRRREYVIEEYRVGGQLRYVKVTPAKGPPYYLIDMDGDGLLETRSGSLDNPEINQWILFQW